MTASARKDVWAQGAAYEPYVGRWSYLVARQFLAWLGVPADRLWLEIGCGTGALTRAVLEQAAPRRLTAVDSSEGFLGYAEDRLADARADFRLGDAQALPVQDAAFDCAVSGLVLNFIPDPAKAVAEMRRAIRSDGTVATYVWDYAAGMQMMRLFWDAAVALDPAAAELDEARRFPLCRPDALSDLFMQAGLEAVETRALDIPTVFKDFDDCWSPFLGGQGPAPGYCLSISEERRSALRERFHGLLPVAADGSIHLTARAWAVRGTRS